MSLQEQLTNEMKEAMRSRAQVKLSTIRMVRASIKNREIQKGKDHLLNDQEVMEVISSAIKQRKDSIEQFEKGGRQDLADREKEEASILQSFLPEPLSKEELIKIIKNVIQETGASGPKEMGKVMKALIPKILGRAEGSIASQIVKDLLIQT